MQTILLKLADDYPNYPRRHDRWGRTGFWARLGGRRYSQSLDEAVGIIKLAKAYDLSTLGGAALLDSSVTQQAAMIGYIDDFMLMLLVIHFIRRDGLRHRNLEIFHVEIGD